MSSIRLVAGSWIAAVCCHCAFATYAAQVLPQPVVDAAPAGAGSVVPEPVRQRARTTSRLVYSCIAPGLVTYSDRPCGPASARRELKVSEPTVAAGSAPDTGHVAAAPADKRREAADKADVAAARVATDRAEKCVKLADALDHVDAEMRAGYPAREAGRMWERWRAARASLREARC
jgi:hypothetical protein